MVSCAHLALVKAEYAYAAQTEDELTLVEDDLYYLMEDDDPEWHKAKVKTSPAASDPAQSGLVPANYLVPAPVLLQVTALYAYESQTDDELTIEEDESLDLYEEHGDWSLVGRSSEHGTRGVGYVPTTYIEAATAPSPQAPTSVPVHSQESSYPAGSTDIATWAVTDIDHKKKKRKGTLGIGNGELMFTSDSDQSDTHTYPISSVSIIKTEKGKHIILQCGSDERHFLVSGNDLDTIVSKIQTCQPESPISPSKVKTITSPSNPLPPALRPPSAMANPDKPLGTNSRKVSFATPTGKPATALYDFDAQGDDELSVVEGDRLYVLDDATDDDWWKCAKESNGQEGVVPASYIELDEGQPSGNPEAADAAMTAAAAQEARKQRIQEEADAMLAQRLAEEDDSEMHQANARAADRKLMAAREAEERKSTEAEAAARRKRESETRSTQRREAERSMSNPGISTGSLPPKLTARPDSEQGGSLAPPRGPESPREGKSKPQGQIRTWRDRTGQFKVEAEFRGLQNGKIRLHKLNGVIIEVPLSKMSTEDVIWLEGATGRNLRNDSQDGASTVKTPLTPTAAPSRPRAEASRRPSGPPRKPTDWFEFFLNAGCDLDDCTRYATNFERDRIDETLLSELEASTMRNLGLREGDVIRVRKYIKLKYGAYEGTSSTNPKAEQIKKDEELARSLQEQESGPAPNIFTNGPNGALKTTRRGRPAPNTPGSSSVDVTSLKLVDTEETFPTANAAALTPAPSSVTNLLAESGGFEDDAWRVRPNSTTPALSTPAVSITRTGSAPVAPSSAEPQGVSKSDNISSATSLNDEIFQKIMSHKKASDALPSTSGVHNPIQPPNISTPNMMTTQPTGLNPDGPRGPLAPVALNAPLLNPLIPTNSNMNGFIPTRAPIQVQPTGFVTHKIPMMQSNTMLTHGPMSNNTFTQAMTMQPTGFDMNNVMNRNPMQPQGMMMSSQPTGMGQLGMMQPQATGFASGYSFSSPQPPPPVPNIPSSFITSSAPPAPKSFNPTDIFAQMKTGQFGSNNATGPQDPNKYNALRTQPTGMMGGPSNTFAQQFMPGQTQLQTGLQPIQPQPTGFAPGGYVMAQPTGMPVQNNVFNNQTQQQQQQQQWRGF